MNVYDALQGLNDASLALTLVKPDSARAAVERGLARVRVALHAGLAAGEDSAATGPPLRSGDVDRRSLLLSMVAGVALPPAAAFDALARLADQARTDRALLAELPELVEAYARAFATTRPAALSSQVRVLVDDLARRLHGPLASSERRALGQLTSDAAAMAGHLAYLDDEPGQARGYLALAREAAQHAADDVRHALAVTLTSSLYSNVSTGTARPSPIARKLLDQARALLPADAPAHYHVWTLARVAEEAAAAGDTRAALSALDQAQRTLPDLAPVDARGYWTDRGMFQGWDAARLDGYRGVVMLRLERAEEALSVLSLALGRQPSAYGRAAVLSDLVAAYAMLGQPASAVRAAHLALDESEATGYRRGIERLKGARALLDPWADSPQVDELDERLYAA